MSQPLPAATPAVLRSGDVSDVVGDLARMDTDVTDAERIDQLAALERLQAACVAAQARVMVDFAQSQVQQQADDGVPARQRGRGVADQIGLACKISPQAASTRLSRARALVEQMPCTLKGLGRGELSERIADGAVRAMSHLTPAQRRAVDAVAAPRLPEMSVREADAAVRRLAYEQDPEATVARIAKAEAERAVWSRPAPDCMGMLSALLPAAQCVAAHAAVDAGARAAKAAGDERSLAQLRADLLVERLTGQAHADDVSVEIGLVVSAEALLDDGDEPAHLDGYGPLPAALARRLAAGGSRSERASSRAWVRRLLTDPIDGTVTGVDTRRREFAGPLRRLIDARDRVCRTPFCDSRIRHRDHVVPFVSGGGTSLANAQGVCARFNYVKEMPGWQAVVTQPGHGGRDGPRSPAHRVEIITPTGHRYGSEPPPALGPGAIPRAPELPTGPYDIECTYDDDVRDDLSIVDLFRRVAAVA